MFKKTILIGPTGFMGPYFLEKHPEIIACGRTPLPEFLQNEYLIVDSENYESLNSVDFENVIFMIGSSDHEILNRPSSLALKKNLLPLFNFLSYLEKTNRDVNKILTFTTMLQYRTSDSGILIDENTFRDFKKNNYIFSKYLAEMTSEYFRSSYDIIDLRMSNVYGETRLRRPDLIPTLAWKCIEKEEISVWNKKPIRDFIYVGDVVKICLELLKSSFTGPINIGTGNSRSVEDVCKIFENLSGCKILDENIPVSGHMNFNQDISRLLNNLDPDFKFTSLEEGIALTYNKMLQYYKDQVGPLNSFHGRS
jgi:nucleoside-diphosphate-sugar epimerase